MTTQKIESLFIKDADDWRVKYIGNRIRKDAEILKAEDVLDETTGWRLYKHMLLVEHRTINDFHAEHRAVCLHVYCVASGYNHNRIAGLTVEHYEDDVEYEPTKHCETVYYKCTQEDIALAEEILNKETLDTTSKTQVDLCWHVLLMDSGTWWDSINNRFETGFGVEYGVVSCEDIARSVKLAYSFPEAFLSECFLRKRDGGQRDWKYWGSVLGMLSFLDLKWFWQGFDRKVLMEGCRKRFHHQISEYCEIRSLSIESELESLMQVIESKLSRRYRRHMILRRFHGVQKKGDIFLSREIPEDENKIQDSDFPWFELEQCRYWKSPEHRIDLLHPERYATKSTHEINYWLKWHRPIS